MKKIVPLKSFYISGNIDPIKGVRLFLKLARKFGLIALMDYQNFEKNEINPQSDSH